MIMTNVQTYLSPNLSFDKKNKICFQFQTHVLNILVKNTQIQTNLSHFQFQIF